MEEIGRFLAYREAWRSAPKLNEKRSISGSFTMLAPGHFE